MFLGRGRRFWVSLVAVAALAVLVVFLIEAGAFGQIEKGIVYVLNPGAELSLTAILVISFILGLLHGATPDEHTWPITFSYAVGSYSTKSGMKAGFAFSSGFTLQRMFLTTLGFLGLAAIYNQYNLDGPVYMVVGVVMVVAGAYILNKKRYIHLPIDVLFNGIRHHTESANRIPLHESGTRNVSLRMAAAHGLIAGFGFGAYATIITFVLAPQVPSLIYAPLPGLFFGLGTMAMQIIFGALFANLARANNLSEDQMKHVGRRTAGRTLYYGGFMFALIGLLILAFPAIDGVAISTGIIIPNLDSVNVSTFLVMVVVGAIGIGSLVSGIRSMRTINSHKNLR